MLLPKRRCSGHRRCSIGSENGSTAVAVVLWAAVARLPLLASPTLVALDAGLSSAGCKLSPTLPSCCCWLVRAAAASAGWPPGLLLRLRCCACCTAASRCASPPGVVAAAPSACNVPAMLAASLACSAAATAARNRNGIPNERAVSSGSAASSAAVVYQLSSRASATSLAYGRPSCSQVRRTASTMGVSACSERPALAADCPAATAEE